MVKAKLINLLYIQTFTDKLGAKDHYLIKFFSAHKSDQLSCNVLEKSIVPEFPKSPDIIIENNFENNISNLSKELIGKIKKNYKR